MGTLIPIPVPSQLLGLLIPPSSGECLLFENQWVLVRKLELINLTADARRWESYHQRDVQKIAALEQEVALLKAEVKDLRNRLFGKKTEKDKTNTGLGTVNGNHTSTWPTIWPPQPWPHALLSGLGGGR